MELGVKWRACCKGRQGQLARFPQRGIVSLSSTNTSYEMMLCNITFQLLNEIVKSDGLRRLADGSPLGNESCTYNII
jgi:hypothetical protein